MNRSVKIVIGLALSIVLVAGTALIYFVFFFELLPVERTRMAAAEVPVETYHLEGYYVGAGATSADAVEIRRVQSPGEYEVIGTEEIGGGLDSLTLEEKGGYVEAVLWYNVYGEAAHYIDSLRFSRK